MKGAEFMPRRGENIRKRKDGRWEGRFIRGHAADGKALYTSVYGKTYAEVKQKLISAQNSSGKPVAANRSAVLLGSLMYAWLEDRRPSLRPQTYTRYMQLIEKHLLQTLGQKKVEKLHAKDINEFLNAKHKKGRVDGTGGLSASSVRLMAYIITSTLDYAAMQGQRINLNGTIHRPAQAGCCRQALSKEEQSRLEAFLLQDLDAGQLGVLLSLRLGLRIGEVCGLRWNDIDLREGVLFVRQCVQRITNHQAALGEAKTVLTTGVPKTVNACRMIPIPSDLTMAIASCKGSEPADFVIQGKSQSFLDPRTCQARFHSYLKQSGLRDVNFHMLRHTFATRCIESGMDVKTLSEILGHANISTTLGVYVHSSLEQKRVQIERVGSIRGHESGSAPI